MDDNKLDKLLHEMKDDYEKVPEYVDKQRIMEKVYRTKRKFNWGRMIPGFAVVTGLLLFVMISLPYLNDSESGDDNTTYLKMYYLKAKEEFRESLAIESLESFHEINQAEIILEDSASVRNNEDLAQIKEEIDFLFSTPKQLLDEINSHKLPDTDELTKLLKKRVNIRRSFQNYFSDLQHENKINESMQEEMITSQHSEQDYEGPSQLAAFLDMLHEQGYRLERSTDRSNKLEIQIDYEWLSANLENLNNYKGLKQYLDLLKTSVDVHHPGVLNKFETHWKDFGKVLLEIERIYDDYPEERELLIEANMIYILSGYLRDYLQGAINLSSDRHQNDENAQLQLKNLLEELEGSRFSGIVYHVLESFDENGGAIDVDRFEYHDTLTILFDERFADADYEDLINLDLVKHKNEHHDLYSEYVVNMEEKQIESLLPKEALLIYLRAFELSHVETYAAMHAENKELLTPKQEEEWLDIIDETKFIVSEQQGDDLINFIFVSKRGLEVAGHIQLMKENGKWKVLNKKIEE
ncbi:hypothetical protein QGM71_15580 [Virgibacillus sp. C22-A2]|uniref:Uncharacterized protein n=1 Tax=Virgibacillus tibetensis TaxID=3042313 RepID=A0ABU6KKF7_9BACI|nr:hypothetical protein [Virgibacillus sp. C22-A2]